MNKELTWEYYGKVAKKFGEKSETDANGNVTVSRRGFSLQFFYEDGGDLDTLLSRSPLFREFMGEQVPQDNWVCEIPSEHDISQWLSRGRRPYPSQIEAIRYAMARPLTLVQGPPGTGKTEMILNLLSAIHGMYPSKTVAVVSANNEAIKNISEKIEGDADFAGLRDVYAQWGNNSVVEKWQQRHPEYTAYFHHLTISNGRLIHRFDPQLLTEIPLFSCTIHSMKKLFLTQAEASAGREAGDTQFDYVIVDECSQVSTLLGLIAMNCAREHLILIGDNEQLTPIIDEDELDELERSYTRQDVPLHYRIASRNTFLAVCGQIFDGKAQNILLNEHFRCHPAIIGFCNENIYDGSLLVRSADNGRFPIRVLWYEGEYSEYVLRNTEDGKIKKSLKNMRQIEIFLREEWPLLRNRLENDISTSICVISPYRGQLESLKRLLSERIAEEGNRDIRDAVAADLEIEGEREPLETLLSCLTIHKAQGKGFDIVCFLSVCDYGSDWAGAWAQQRSMINVAVSRAKKELHLVTSSRWLPERLQSEETGYVLPLPQDSGKYYFLRLLDYVYTNLPGGTIQDVEFGFHRSALTSLFDRVPWYRNMAGAAAAERTDTAADTETAMSAPEKCMQAFLLRNLPEGCQLYREVPLEALYPARTCPEPELREYIENGATVDFLICRGTRALLAIEVDGAQHRAGEEIKKRDKLKNKCFELMANETALLRADTDGSGCWTDAFAHETTVLTEEEESSFVLSRIAAAEILPGNREFSNAAGNAPDCHEADQEDLLAFYKTFLRSCLEQFSQYMFGKRAADVDFSRDRPISPLPDLGYLNHTQMTAINHGDPATDAYYFCKYGMAYACEYALLYEILLRIHQGEQTNGTHQFGVYSFGCGGFVDAWALVYARAKLRVTDPDFAGMKLYYRGIDKANDIPPWPVTLFQEWIDEIRESNRRSLENPHILCENMSKNISQFTFIKPLVNGIENFMRPGENGEPNSTLYYNVLMFAKILNLLEERPELLDSFIASLQNLRLARTHRRRDYYICVSHSPGRLEHGLRIVQRIVEEVFCAQGFVADADLEEILGEERFSELCANCRIQAHTADTAYPYYFIISREQETGEQETIHITDIDPVFYYEDTRRFLRNLSGILGDQAQCNQMGLANMVFQIIRLRQPQE